LDTWLRAFGGAYREARPIRTVIASGAPFEIIGAVISLVLIYMVYLSIIVWVINECFCDNPMHPAGLLRSIKFKVDIFISILLSRLRKDFAMMENLTSIHSTTVPIKASNAPKVRNLIDSFVSAYITPFFACDHFLPPTF
jgi:hypothetical protein